MLVSASLPAAAPEAAATWEARVAAAAPSAARARLFTEGVREIETDPALSADAKLHRAWAAYLLAANDAERAQILAVAAKLPDVRVRMLIGSFREFPELKKLHAEADRAHTARLPKRVPAEGAAGKKPSPREVFGPNPFDAPFTEDRWEDPYGFVGRWQGYGFSADLVAFPADNFLGVLTDATNGATFRLLGIRTGDTLELFGPGVRGSLTGAILSFKAGAKSAGLRRVRVGYTHFDRRPDGAQVLLDSTTGLRHFRQGKGDAAWTVLPDGAVEIDPGKGSIHSRAAWGDVRGYLEFRHAYNSEGLGPRRGNSGLYLFNAYEIQLVDSFGLPAGETSEGSIYHIAIPRVAASAPPLEWQSLEFDFRAPRFDATGRKIANARLTLWLNGVEIHHDIELPKATGGAPGVKAGETDPLPPQPLMLQNHGNRIQFRNIWVLPRS